MDKKFPVDMALNLEPAWVTVREQDAVKMTQVMMVGMLGYMKMKLTMMVMSMMMMMMMMMMLW